MSPNPIGQEVKELYDWMRWNKFKMNDRQKRELKTIFAKAVRKHAQATTDSKDSMHQL